jgi:GNAT superfamily N-acetyltransferase
MSDIEQVPLDQGSADEDERIETLQWQVEDLFDECGVRMASYDEPILGFAHGDELVAALVGGAPHGDPFMGMRFSVVVSPDFRRQGFARKLIESFVSQCESDGMPVEAWVVNEEAMAPLLEDLGFSCDDHPFWTL